VLILGVFPAHLLAELSEKVPVTMVLCWFVSNVTEAMLGAIFIRRFAGDALSLGTLRAAVVFCCAAVLAPFLSSFLDAAFVRMVGWGNADYWTLVGARFPSNALSVLTFVPVAITWGAAEPAQRARLPEAGALLGLLLAACIVVFDSGVTEPLGASALLYLPVPFLMWAALRFGPRLTSTCYSIVAFLVIWGAGHGRGPFLQAVTYQDALSIQLFLISLAVPMLLLAAVIEERRDSERKLRASEELFSSAFRFSPDPIAISRRSDGHIIEANDRWLELLRYDRRQLARGELDPLEAHIDRADHAKFAALARDQGDLRDVELTLRDCGGNSRQTLVSVAPVELRGEACVINIVRDITAQRQAEADAYEQRKQLTHLTRVVSLTDFSSTLAHELNQPLTAILSNAQAAQRFLARDPPNVQEVRSILAEIADADKRAGQLIQRLRVLMKKGEEEFLPTDLNQLVTDVLEFIRGEFVMRNVAVRASLWPDLPQVDCDRVQLQQLVLNLISNACEAMQDHGGEKTLSIATVHQSDDTVQVVVTDSGPGIPPDQLERIFEPFVTTKEQGLGLGLAICRKIARAHRGSLVADSHYGDGASFRLVLPRTSTPDSDAS
jgi:PAS domain S-box-containing protein